MENIIRDFLEKSIKEIYEEAAGIFAERQDFSVLVESIKEKTDEIGRQICVQILRELDEGIRQDPRRKKDWEIVRKDDKAIITRIGEIRYWRTYFESKKGKGHKYLTDEVAGIESHQRTDAGIRAEMIDLAAEVSYRKSGKKAGSIELSGQTVMNSIRQLEDIEELRLPEKKKEIEILYVEADEDHVSLQDGSRTVARLVYIHEGKEMKGKRSRLENVYYYADARRKPEEIWQEVAKYVENNYETDKVKRIYVSGDGADWIKQGLEYLPNARFVLDRYHLNKYVLTATGHAMGYRSELWEALNRVDQEKVKEVLKEIEDAAQREADKDQVSDTRKYILNNWEGIEIQALEDAKAIGCSAEGHISHVLSARLSSRPLGWSRHGADQMAKLRAFRMNGGNTYNLLLNQKKEDKLYEMSKAVRRQMRKNLKQKVRETFNNIEVFNYGKVTPIYKALKNLQYA